MASISPLIRPATKADIIALRGSLFPYSFRGITGEVDGKVLGMAGVLHSDPLLSVSLFTPEGKRYKRAIIKAGVEYRALLRSYNARIFSAQSKDEPGAETFLKHFGFSYVREERKAGRIYQWAKQSSNDFP